MEIEDADRLVAKRRPSVIPFVAAGALVLAGTVVALLAWPADTDPSRVLVVVSGCSDEHADAIVRQLGVTLERGGFELVRASGTPADVDRAREEAASEGAGHALIVELTVHEQREPGPIDPAYASVTITAALAAVGDEPTVRATSPRIGAHGRQLAQALEGAAIGAAFGVADALHLALLERASVRALTEELISDRERAERQNAIRGLLDVVERARAEHGRMAESCEEAASELAVGGGRCLSDACAEEYAFDVTSDGAAALVHVDSPSARVPIEEPFRFADRVESEERIEIVPLDGSERRVLARAANYYTYPTYAAGRVVAIEQWPGGFGLVSIDVESGERTAIARFEGRFVQSPELSPDGARVLYRVRTRRSEPARLAVSPVSPQPPVTLLGEARLATWVVLAAGAAEPRALIAELVPLELLAPREQEEPAEEGSDASGEPALRLALLDPDTAQPVAWLDDEGREVEAVAGVIDGRLAFTWTDGVQCGVGLWDARTGQATYARTSPCVSHPRAAGRAIVATAVTAEAGDPRPLSDAELVVVDPQTGAVRALTANALRERYPRPAGDDLVVFDRVGQPRLRAFPRVATCVAELPRD